MFGNYGEIQEKILIKIGLEKSEGNVYLHRLKMIHRSVYQTQKQKSNIVNKN